MSAAFLRASSRIGCLALTAVTMALQGPRLAAQSTAVTGDQRTLVIIADFTDQAVSCSPSSIHGIMFDPLASVDAVYRDSSNGHISFSGDVVGPFTISRGSTDPCSLSALSTAAQAAATAAGIDVATYPRKMYVMPPNSCGATGNGSLGGSSTHAWIFSCDTPGAYEHEVGHNLGIHHASSGNALGDNEFGDGSDPMSVSGLRFRGLNAPHRHQLGWLDANQLQRVTQPASYRIAPLDVAASALAGPQVLMIAKPDTGEQYYVSYRREVGFDTYLDPGVFGRLSIHRYAGDGSSTRTYLVATVNDGASFVDSVNGIQVTHTSHTSSYADVRVELTGTACTPAVPSLAISPQTQSAPAGSSRDFALAVTNNDSPGCPATTFALSHVLPSGWAGQFATATVTIAPGGSGQSNLRITSPPTATTGSYRASVTAADSGAPARNTSRELTYNLTDTVAPTVPARLTAMASKKRNRIELSWRSSTDNVRVAGYRVSRNGVVVADASGTTWSDLQWSPGSYTYSVVAYDSAGNMSAASNIASVTLR